MSDKHAPPLILVADDQKPTTIMLERVFEYEGYQVQSVYDGVSALETAETILPDLILLDINMPGLNGFEVLERLRNNPQTSSIPTIIITAMDELSNVVQGLNLGADDYLRKPFHPQELLARAQSKMRARQLEEALQRRTQDLTALLRVSEELSRHLAINELLRIISFLVADLLPCQLVTVCYLNAEGKITDQYANGKTHEHAASPLDQPTVNHMLEKNRALLWPGDSPVVPQYGSGISVPMQHGEATRGFLMILNDEPRYDRNHLRLLEGISRQAALALHNAELYAIQADYSLHLEDMVAERTAELESAQQMLIRSEKLASVGRLAASIAHEINNPLLPIQINLEGMLEDVNTNCAVSAKDIHRTLESVERIKTIVSRLLGFTGNRQVDEGEFDYLDVNEVIQGIVNLNRKFFQHEGMCIDVSLSPLPHMFGSKYQLEHVFMNLTLNAKDAMPKGGVLKITTGHEDEEIVVEFQDNGTGIPPELIDKIFEPFVSTKETGSGLGLFISYGIVQRHNGTIHVESKPGQGTQFTLRFPVSQSKFAETQPE